MAPNAISGCYTFDMRQSCHIPSLASASPHLTSMTERDNTELCSAKKLYRKSRSAAATQPGMRAFIFRDTETDDAACAHSLERRTRSHGCARTKRCSFRTILSFLQSWHGRDHLESRPSTPSTKSGTSTSGSEDGEVVEPGLGLESVPAVRKEKRDAIPSFNDDAPQRRTVLPYCTTGTPFGM